MDKEGEGYMNTTIIDVLKKGNLELFHSSIISWLLSPRENKGIDLYFLKEFLGRAFNKQSPIDIASIKSDQVKIYTEAKGEKGRYDILINIENCSFIIENKTKSIGKYEQLEKYDNKAKKKYVIALGLFEESFCKKTKEEFPLVTYTDVYEIISTISEDQVEDPDFLVLLRHYQQYLHRELTIMSSIKKRFNHNETILLPKADKIEENDIRFFNLYFLKQFEKYRQEHESKWFMDKSWHGSNKNMRSGVWYAFHSKHFKWNSQIENFQKEQSLEKASERKPLKLYFHVELYAKNGVFETDSKAPCGEIQLRGNKCKDGNKVIFDFFENYLNIEPDDHYLSFAKRKNHKSGNYYVLKRTLYKHDLYMDRLNDILKEFTSMFGEIDD